MKQSLLSSLKPRFSREEWNVGVLDQSFASVVREGIVRTVQWLPSGGAWLMLADPAYLARQDGSNIVFAECMDHRIGRGEIWAARLRPGECPANAPGLRRWMRGRAHLSYPRPITTQDGRTYFMAECWQSGALQLWRVEGEELIHVGAIIKQRILDPTPWHDGATWWLFCTFQDDGPNARLRLFFADELEGPWTPHAGNPVKVDLTSARPAGPIVAVGEELIRPAQDCSGGYGGAITLNRITRLDRSSFTEVAIRTLSPILPYPNGLHTLCPAGDRTLIDGKRSSLQPSDIPRKLVGALGDRLRPIVRPALPSRLPLPA